MTKEEVFEVLVIIENEFPRYFSNQNELQKSGKLNLWYAMFKDDDKKDVNRALYKLIATSQYPPTIADIRKALKETTMVPTLTGGEAWGQVQNAIHNFGYRQKEKALAEMSETTRRVVDCMGWETLCTSDVENTMADRAHFLKIYQSIESRTSEQALIPQALKAQIDKRIAVEVEKMQVESKEVEPIQIEAVKETDGNGNLQGIGAILRSLRA